MNAGRSDDAMGGAVSYACYLDDELPAYFESSPSDPTWRKTLVEMANRGLDDKRARIVEGTAQLLGKLRAG